MKQTIKFKIRQDGTVIEEEYLIEGNNQDDYRVFVFSTNFSEEKDLKSIEFIPGNPAAVHHVLINIDTDGECAALDNKSLEQSYTLCICVNAVSYTHLRAHQTREEIG